MVLFNTAVRVRMVERGTQSQLNHVHSIVIPTSVCCSLGGECYHTSWKREGLQNVSMNAIKSSVKDELERRNRFHLAWYIFPDHSECSNT